MRLQSATTKVTQRGWLYTTPCCPRCGDRLYAAIAATFVDEKAIGHQWTCEACGYEFRTTVTIPAKAAA